jgi:hypothetical protein
MQNKKLYVYMCNKDGATGCNAFGLISSGCHRCLAVEPHSNCQVLEKTLANNTVLVSTVF